MFYNGNTDLAIDLNQAEHNISVLAFSGNFHLSKNHVISFLSSERLTQTPNASSPSNALSLLAQTRCGVLTRTITKTTQATSRPTWKTHKRLVLLQ